MLLKRTVRRILILVIFIVSVANLHAQNAKDTIRRSIDSLKRTEDTQQKYNDIASAYVKLDDPDTAIFYFRKALQLNTILNAEKKNYHLAITYRRLGDYFITQQNYDSALIDYHQAIVQLIPGFSDDDIRSNPIEFTGDIPLKDLYLVLLAKAKAFTIRFQTDHNKNDLLYSLFTYDALYRLAEHVVKTQGVHQPDSIIAGPNLLPHNEPVDNALKLFDMVGDSVYLRHAFKFDERYRITRATLQKDSKVTAFSSKNIDELTKIIPTDHAIISYHVGDTNLVGFVITRNSIGHFVARDTIANKTNEELYRILFTPISSKVKSVDNLTIVRDEQLMAVQLDTLRNQTGSPLSQDFNVMYSENASLFSFEPQKNYAWAEPLMFFGVLVLIVMFVRTARKVN